MAVPSAEPIPTSRSAATQLPPSAQENTVTVAAHTRAKPTPKPKPAAKPKPAGLGPQLPGFTPAEQASILAQAQAAQQPALQSLQAAQTAADAQNQAAQQTVGGYYHALAPLLAKIAPAVQQGYTQAAGLDALLGKGFGDQLSAGDPALNAANQHIMSLTGGSMAPVDSSPVGAALGWLGGGLPAAGLNQVGAAANAQARQVPAQVGAQGGEQVASLAAKGLLADQGFQQKQSDLAAQLPSLVQKYGAAAVDAAIKQQNQASLDAYRQAQLNLGYARLSKSGGGKASGGGKGTVGKTSALTANHQADILKSVRADVAAGLGGSTPPISRRVPGGTGDAAYEYWNPATSAWETTPPAASTKSYNQAMNDALLAIPPGAPQSLTARAIKIVKAAYPEGKNGRPFSEGPAANAAAIAAAQKGLQKGLTAQEALSGMIHTVIPPKAAQIAIARVYGAASNWGSPLAATGLK